MPKFNHYIGIDYSGAKHSYAKLPGISVAQATRQSIEIFKENDQNWSRKSLAEWIVKVLQSRERERVIIGIDHAFSFPSHFLHQNNFDSWDKVINYTSNLLPIDNEKNTVFKDVLTQPNIQSQIKLAALKDENAFRITEKLSHKMGFRALPTFQFKWRNVAYSTFAGIPWLGYIRENVPKDKLHFWPFDGCDKWEIPEGKSAIVEVYPRLFNGDESGKKILPPESFGLDNEHERDAYCVAKWMKDKDGACEKDGTCKLDNYLKPELNVEQKKLAELEGWILGVLPKGLE